MIILTSVMTSRRESTFVPLEDADLEKLGIKNDTPIAPESAPGSSFDDQNTGRESVIHSKQIDKPPPSLNRVPKQEEIRGFLVNPYGQLYAHAETNVYKLLDALAAKQNDDPGYLYEVGTGAFHVRDYQTAKPYLEAALRVETDAARREAICEDLAWLQEETQAAQALLRESTKSGDPWRLFQAYQLAEVTESEALKHHYELHLTNMAQQMAESMTDSEIESALKSNHIFKKFYKK